MNLTPREIVLATIEQARGKIQGRTLLQKRIYFLGVLLDINLGYRPYYYGPYSPLIEAAQGELIGLRFAEEHQSSFGFINEEGFEVKRYDYELTEDGKMIAERLRKRKEEDYEKVVGALKLLENAGKLDYQTLSVAAKAHYILSRENKPMTREEIISVAKELKWNISDERKFEEAADFLEKLGVINRGS